MAKLLPSSNSAIVKYQKSAVVKSNRFLNIKAKTTSVKGDLVKESPRLLGSSLSEIEKKVVQIDKLLKDSLLLSKKEDETKRKNKEKEKFEGKEKELEKKKPPLIKGIKLPSPPKMGFLDWIKNFITQTILGFFAVRLIDFLPQLLKILPVIIKVGDFFIDVGGKMLDGLITFVDWGYKAIDGTRSFIKQLGGEGLAQNFDKFAGAIDNVIEIAIIAALATADSGGLGNDPGVDSKRPKGPAGKPSRGPISQLGRKAFVGILGKGGAKAVLKFVRPFTKRLPIIGGLLDFGLSIALGEKIGRAAFRAIGATLLGAIGAAVGGPFALLTGLAGGTLGDIAGGALYDLFFENKKPKGKTVKAAGGGKPATRGGKPVSGPAKRTIAKKKAPRTLRATPSKLKPGGVIGGEKKIKELYPESKDKSKMSPFDFLKNSYDTFAKSSGLGALVALAIKPIMGDKPTYADYKNAGTGVNNWMNQSIASGTLAYAGGGEVKMESIVSGEDYSDVIAKSLQDSVSPQVDKTIQDLMKQLMLKKEEPGIKIKKEDEYLTPEEGMGDATLSESEMDLFQRLIVAESGGQGLIGQALVARSVLNRAGLIQSGKASTGTFAAKDGTVTGVITGRGQYQPYADGNPNGSINKPRTPAQMNAAKEAIKLAQDPERLKGLLKSEGIDDGSIRKLLAATGFRAGYAFRDRSQNVNVVKYKDHYFNTAGNTALIVASSQVSEKINPVSLKGGDGRFIQGNSGRSGGNHFHIGTNKPGDGSGVAAAGFNVIKHFLGKKSIHVGRSRENIPTKATDEQIRGYIARGQAAHGGTELDLQIGGMVGPGTKVPFPLALKGMKYSDTDGYGVSADIVGTNAFVGHGRYKPDGTLAPQQGRVRFSLGAPDFYAFHGMNKVMSKDGLLKFHKGEYISVTDADSFRLVGNILTDINSIENKAQLVARAPSIIEKLKSISGYTDYEQPEPEVVFIPLPTPDSGGVSSGAPKSSLTYNYLTIDTMGEQMSDNLMYG